MTHSMFCSDTEATVVPGTLRGYRAWRVSPYGLQSTNAPYTWSPTGNAATCQSWGYITLGGEPKPPPVDHQAPNHECGCGFYGWYHADDHRLVTADVVGVIAASGRIVLGTHGFRAEKAEILAVAAKGPVWQQGLQALGYTVFEDEQALFDAYPADDVSGLVEHECDDACGETGSNWITLQPGGIILTSGYSFSNNTVRGSYARRRLSWGQSVSLDVADEDASVVVEVVREKPAPDDTHSRDAARALTARARQREADRARLLAKFSRARNTA